MAWCSPRNPQHLISLGAESSLPAIIMVSIMRRAGVIAGLIASARRRRNCRRARLDEGHRSIDAMEVSAIVRTGIPPRHRGLRVDAAADNRV
jgi:hypothetical protein